MPEAAGLYYEEHGASDAPVLLVSSGLGGSAGYWAPNLAAFAAHFRVIAYDHRGTGRSERALPGDLSLADLGADMLALMDALGIAKASFMGHAIGGMAALELARRVPDRVERLVVINGWTRLDPQTARCFKVRLTLLREAGVEPFLEAQPLFLFPPDWLSENDGRLRAESATHLAHWPGDAVMEARIGAARCFDASDWIGEIACPVLAVSAADDLLVPWRNSLALAQAVREGAHLAYTWGAHAVNASAPDPFNRDVPAWLTGKALPNREP